MLNLLQSDTRQSVSMALDGLQQRYMAIGSNVANAETPGYKAVDVRFEDALKAMQKDLPNSSSPTLDLAASQSGHMTERGQLGLTGKADETFAVQSQYRNDGNGVDMDKEMAYMSQTGQRYMALSQIEGKLYKSVRALITS